MSLDAVLTFLQNEFGLVLFTVIAVVLMGYLAYSMARPERF
jgi:K+-transporting ATPase KdpF subunit